jgi:hypothetical protein
MRNVVTVSYTCVFGTDAGIMLSIMIYILSIFYYGISGEFALRYVIMCVVSGAFAGLVLGIVSLFGR